MDCDQYKKLISDLIDNSADADAAERLKQHLNECESCRRACKEMKQIDNSIKSGAQRFSPLNELTDEYWANYQNRLEEKLQKDKFAPSSIFAGLSHSLIAIAAIIFIAFAITLFVAVSQYQDSKVLKESLRAARERIAGLTMVRSAGVIKLGSVAIARDVKLFREMDVTMASGLKWVATDGDKITIGMESTIIPSAAAAQNQDKNIAVIGISVLESASGASRLISHLHIVARDGSKATLQTDIGALKLNYECLVNIKGMDKADMQVSVGFSKPQDIGGGLINTALTIQSGEEKEIARLTLGNTSYSISVSISLVSADEYHKVSGTQL